MTYIATISLPIAFDALSDDQARLVMEHIEDVLAMHVTLPHNAEYADAASVVLQESLPHQELRTIYTELDFVARQAPVEAGSAGDCDICGDFETTKNR